MDQDQAERRQHIEQLLIVLRSASSPNAARIVRDFVEAVREGLISRGLGGEILGIGFHEREALYARRGIVYDYTEEDLDQERADRARVFGP